MTLYELLRQFAPNGKAYLLQALVAGWPKLAAAGIASPLRVAHFLTQLATETGGFAIFEENMNYSAERMCQVWPSRFKSAEAARPFAHNPERLANNVYGGRMGNVDAGDGWKYHGRGFMQTTGRDNYRRCGHERDPEALLDPAVALDAALEEWTRGKLNAVADEDNLLRIRKVINGGLIGIEHARDHLARAKRIFTADALARLDIGQRPASPVPSPPSALPGPRAGTQGTPMPPTNSPLARKPAPLPPAVSATAGGAIATATAFQIDARLGVAALILVACLVAWLEFRRQHRKRELAAAPSLPVPPPSPDPAPASNPPDPNALRPEPALGLGVTETRGADGATKE